MEQKSFATSFGNVCCWCDRSAGSDVPWMVFLPGLTADHRLFDKQLEYFVGKFNCLTWDAPAHGQSRPFELSFSLDDVAEILFAIFQEEGIEKPILIGQSFGAYISQALIDLHPGVAAGMVSVDSASLQLRYYKKWELACLKHTEGMYRTIPWKMLVKWSAEGNAITDNGRKNMRAMNEIYEKGEFCKLTGLGFKILAEAIEQDRAYAIDCPALLLCGDKDQTGFVKRYNREWSDVSGISLVWVPNAAHNSNDDNPSFVNNQIQSFVTNLSK